MQTLGWGFKTKVEKHVKGHEEIRKEDEPQRENNPLNKILFNSRTALMAYNAQMYKD